MLELRVLFGEQRRLDRRRWQDAIRDGGFELTLAGELPPAHGVSLFVPCTFEGLESGFDLVLERFEATEWSLPSEDAARVAAFDAVLTLTTYANAQEIAGSLTAAAADAAAVDGAILDAYFEERIVPAAEALEWARSKLADARRQFDGPSRLRNSRRPAAPKPAR